MLDIDKVPIFIFNDKTGDYDILFCHPEQFEKDHIFLQVDSSRVYRIKVPQPHICSGYLLNFITNTSILNPMMDEDVMIYKKRVFLKKMTKIEETKVTYCKHKYISRTLKKTALSKES